MAISLGSLVICGVLSSVKFRYAIHLESASLYKAGICSLLGTVLSATMFINTTITMVHSSSSSPKVLLWLNPMIAMLSAAGAFVLGAHAVYVARFLHDLPIFGLAGGCSAKETGEMKHVEGLLNPTIMGPPQPTPRC